MDANTKIAGSNRQCMRVQCMTSFYAFTSVFVWTGVNDDRLRVDGDKNMHLLAFAFTIVFVWTGPKGGPLRFASENRFLLNFPHEYILVQK